MSDLNGFDLTGKRVWVAGHRGLVGAALVRRLEAEPIAELVTATRTEVDLRRQADTEAFVYATRPDVIIHAAALTGGIHHQETHQGAFLYENLMIAVNVLEAARQAGVSRTVVLGSSCIYPREAPQPMVEEALLSGALEPTTEGYAIAKIAALEMVKMYRRQYNTDMIAAMSTNLYGPGDNFNLETAHVIPALMRKIHEAKVSGAATVELWGSGKPRREFLYVDDFADAVIHLTSRYTGEAHINIGSGTDLTVAELAKEIAQVVGWQGEFVHDTTMPDGPERKLLDITRLRASGWDPKTMLQDGLRLTYEWYRSARGSEKGERLPSQAPSPPPATNDT